MVASSETTHLANALIKAQASVLSNPQAIHVGAAELRALLTLAARGIHRAEAQASMGQLVQVYATATHQAAAQAFLAALTSVTPSGGMLWEAAALLRDAVSLVASGTDTSGISTVSVSCGGCTIMPQHWRFTVSTYTGRATVLNGTWTMAWQNLCFWQAVSGTVNWAMQYSSGNWTLFGTDSGTGTGSHFSLSSSSFACMGPNTLPYLSGTGDTGAPSSISVAGV